jgi:hypothetical protein
MTTQAQAREQLTDYWRKLPERLTDEAWSPVEEAKRLDLLAQLCREAAGALPLGDDVERVLRAVKELIGITYSEYHDIVTPHTRRVMALRRAAFALEMGRLGVERHGVQWGERRGGRPRKADCASVAGAGATRGTAVGV